MVNNSFVSNIYVGNDGKLHKVQGGADSVLPFSGGGIKITGYTTVVGSGSWNDISLPFDVSDYTKLTIGTLKVTNTSSFTNKVSIIGDDTTLKTMTSTQNNISCDISSISSLKIDMHLAGAQIAINNLVIE